MKTKRKLKAQHKWRGFSYTDDNGINHTCLITTSPMAKGVAYLVFIDGKRNDFWSGFVKSGGNIRAAIHDTLRMMNKCGYWNKPFDRARHRYWEKLEKLEKWKNSLK